MSFIVLIALRFVIVSILRLIKKVYHKWAILSNRKTLRTTSLDQDLHLSGHPRPQVEIGGFQFDHQCVSGVTLLHHRDR
jgi:hypothetical protein